MSIGDESVGEAMGEGALHSMNALVFAIAHEIGNHLGAVRLQAHLLDDDLDSHSLALASVEIDGLAGRAGALLALIRPILSQKAVSSRDQASETDGPAWASLLGGIAQHYEDEGTRGVSLVIDELAAPDRLAPNTDWLHTLLLALLDATLASMPKQGSIRLGLTETSGQILLAIEDDGPDEDLSKEAALRGRPLVVALARALLVLVDGDLGTSRTEGRTRVEWVFPAGAQADLDQIGPQRR